MWLAHRGGFTAVVREGDADAGRARVRVLQTGEVLTVDEDDLEKVRFPESLDLLLLGRQTSMSVI